MLQFISHYTDKYSYLDSIRLALQGGCRWIQLRMKDATDDEVRPVAIEAQKLCKQYGATFIIDDRVALVKELQADGVHLGKNDMPISEARRQLGPDYIIGGTANTIWDVKAHYAAGADYIGCGPFRFTTTKQKLSPVLGLDGYRRIIIARLSRLRDRRWLPTDYHRDACGAYRFTHCGYRRHYQGRYPRHTGNRHHRHCPEWYGAKGREPH